MWRKCIWLICVAALAAAWPGAAEEVQSTTQCHATAEPGPDFGMPKALSDPTAAAFVPAVAARGQRALVAWQETSRKDSRVAWVVSVDGCVGPVHRVEDSLSNPRRPAVAATASGWVLAYEAKDTPTPLIRAVRLDPTGLVTTPPVTVSEPGQVASRVRVATNGDDVVFSWTNVLEHYIARQGPVEELAPTRVGTRLSSAGLVNYPRVAVDASGTIFLAYRDGGPERTDFEIRLLSRKLGESFSKSINISRSKGLMSDDVAMAVESDGRLQLVWVEQDGERPETFEVVHATLDRSFELSEPMRFGTLGLPSFKPSVVPGLATVWQAGTVRSGRLFFADGPEVPRQILPALAGGMTSMAADASGDLHLAFVDTATPPRLRYAWRHATTVAVPAAEPR